MPPVKAAHAGTGGRCATCCLCCRLGRHPGVSFRAGTARPSWPGVCRTTRQVSPHVRKNNRCRDLCQPPMNAERRNLYRILHVQPEAPTEIIKASYRALMSTLRVHPDLGGDPARAAEVNHAYAVLMDPERRRAYDLSLKAASRQACTCTACTATRPLTTGCGPVLRRQPLARPRPDLRVLPASPLPLPAARPGAQSPPAAARNAAGFCRLACGPALPLLPHRLQGGAAALRRAASPATAR